MSRYFIKNLSVEGFRGINNDGDPLQLDFRTDATNSIFGENGRGKSSLFEALNYAFTGRIPKLEGLPADDKSEDYYCNRFHSTQNATITITVVPDAGGPEIVIRVKRDKAGKRTVDSPSGFPDAAALLNALDGDLTLLDYSTFRHFVEDSPLQRGRAFSALLGLSKLSTLRQTFEVIANKGNLKSDLALEADESELAQSRSLWRSKSQMLETEHQKLLGRPIVTPFNGQAVSIAVCEALRQVPLISSFFAGDDLSKIDCEAVKAAIRTADASDKRKNLENTIKSISALDKLASLDIEDTEVTALEAKIQAREQAFRSTKGPLFLNLYQDLENIFETDQYDDTVCPACEAQQSEALRPAVKWQLEQYIEVSRLRKEIPQAWKSSALFRRLRSLEATPEMGIPDNEQTSAAINDTFATGNATLDDLRVLVSRLQSLEETRGQRLAEAKALKSKLEAELPPSLVALTEQVESARSIQMLLAELKNLKTEGTALNKWMTLKDRWAKFIAYAESTFSAAEVSLSTEKTLSFESRYRNIYEKITGNPSILPVLRKAKGSQELHLRLERFYTLSDVSAATLLPESFRNALAISIYLTAALSSDKASRFIVLDDVTSSFDAGHQFNLMQVFQTEVVYPHNPDGLQLLVLSHDGLLEKFFDKMGEEMGWNHQRLDGLPPCGNVLTTKQDTQRIRADAERFLNAGQVAQAKPLIRQFLEFSLLRVMRKLDIRAPLDFVIRDESKMVKACIDAITNDIDLHQRASDLILTPK